jgi:hypothetical protein
VTKPRSTHITTKPQGITSRAPVPAPEPPAPVALPGAWVRFWFTPVDPIGLHVLRVLAGLLFLCWLLPFSGQLDALFGLQGWFDLMAYHEAGRLPGAPMAPVSWSLVYLVGTDPAGLAALYWASVAVLALFTLGVCPRVTGVLTWVIVASFTANPATAYDADVLLAILAMYLAVGYLGLAQRGPGISPSWRLLGPAWLVGSTWLVGDRAAERALWRRESLAANIALRLLQVHFALVMVMSGLHKLQFGEWWSGLAPWFALHRPFETTLQAARSLAPFAGIYLFLVSLGAYLGLAWQIGFPLFAWRRRLRVLLVGGAALGWLSMALVYRLPLFGPAIVIFCLGYLTPDEWHWLAGLVGRLPGWRRLQFAGAGRPMRGEAGPGKASTLVAPR